MTRKDLHCSPGEPKPEILASPPNPHLHFLNSEVGSGDPCTGVQQDGFCVGTSLGVHLQIFPCLHTRVPRMFAFACVHSSAFLHFCAFSDVLWPPWLCLHFHFIFHVRFQVHLCPHLPLFPVLLHICSAHADICIYANTPGHVSLHSKTQNILFCPLWSRAVSTECLHSWPSPHRALLIYTPSITFLPLSLTHRLWEV